jgi:hypothetical protein
MADVDWSDPCAKAAALTGAYYALLQGQQEIEIRTRTLDAEEVVRFCPANLDALRSEMQAAASACAKASGQPDPNRRFAITCGGRPWRFRGGV